MKISFPIRLLAAIGFAGAALLPAQTATQVWATQCEVPTRGPGAGTMPIDVLAHPDLIVEEITAEATGRPDSEDRYRVQAQVKIRNTGDLDAGLLRFDLEVSLPFYNSAAGFADTTFVERWEQSDGRGIPAGEARTLSVWGLWLPVDWSDSQKRYAGRNFRVVIDPEDTIDEGCRGGELNNVLVEEVRLGRPARGGTLRGSGF